MIGANAIARHGAQVCADAAKGDMRKYGTLLATQASNLRSAAARLDAESVIVLKRADDIEANRDPEVVAGLA